MRGAGPALALLSAVALLGMSPWFAAAAAGEGIQAALGLSDPEAGWLLTIVPLGFVVGTATSAVLNVADTVPARRLVAISAFAAALSNAALLIAPAFVPALAARFTTGFFMAGIYPPAMKMASTWFRGRRGLAIGTLVGALTVGKAMPYLVASFDLGVAAVIWAASGASALAGLGVLVGYRDGPYAFPSQPFYWGRVGDVLRDQRTRLATLGYVGHMWELYAVWGTIALFLTECLHAAGATEPSTSAKALAFSVIAAGGVGAVGAGWAADRWGRERAAGTALVISGACAFSAGWLVGGSLWIILPLVWIWGVSVVADSAQFSALATETAAPHLVGTALTLQVSVGFLVSMITVQALPGWAAAWGWGPAYSLLGLGPVCGVIAMVRLARVRAGDAQARERTV